MFGLFQNNTPPYAGDGQPSAGSSGGGGLGFLGGLFSFSSTPNYATRTEPATEPAVGAPVLLVPVQSECMAQGEQLAAPPDCRVPLPCAIVIQRSEQ